MTEVAVVILNYNGRNFLHQFLPSVIAYSSTAKIIVADNGSTDDSLSLLEKGFPQIEIIKIGSNLGYCGGYNYALKRVEAEYYVLLNSDVEVTDGWIDPIQTLFKRDSTIAAAQPKILSYHQKDTFEYAGAGGGYIDSLGYPFCRGRIFDRLEKDQGQYNDTRSVFWATGACLFIRSNIFHSAGGLDEDFFAHMEEIDLCWRLNRAGHRVYYVGSSTVYHVGAGTLPKSNPHKTYLNFTNGFSLLVKHLPANKFFWKLPLRIILDLIAALTFLFQGSPADFGAVIRAILNSLRMFPYNLSKRKKLTSQIPGYHVSNQYKGLLVADYYLLGKKTFEDLSEFSNPR
ncbi:MAG: glycosyltransferase family 2 protein [Cyclobacteriaceae bacterium]|nr:glycosyltransferase family 2 protein [Cyclobacteriaceae bacterium]